MAEESNPDSPIYPPGHSPKWWRQHPELWTKHLANMPSPGKSSQSNEAKPHLLQVVRALSGPAFIVGGWGVISTSFGIGVFAIYFGFGLLFAEIVVEPWIIRKTSLFIHCMLLALCLIPVGWFTLTIVAVSAPLTFDAYAMRKGDYPPGTSIGGIAWNPRLTDLRIAIRNASEDDYYDLDLKLSPDEWTYKASVLDDSGCTLITAGGNARFTAPVSKEGETTITPHFSGDSAQAPTDDMGNMYETLATDGGYRLKCSVFPANYTITVVFALASVPPLSIPPGSLKPGEQGMVAAAVKGPRRGLGTLLAPRPNPTAVNVQGKYKRGEKPFAVTRIVKIG